eukprot:2248230-Prymnesium_polylepis.1
MADALLTESIQALSLKDLRGLVCEAGLTTDGCLDKADLRGRAREAIERLKCPGAKLGPLSQPLVAAIVAEELQIFKEPPTFGEPTEREAVNKEAAAAKEAAEQEAAAAQKRREAAEREA